MFGRSGQMFPRQRAFHDAIYEEEYGSEQEDECCQSRGMSAVFCWFLSVIILIGLATSVVLSVFFILKSKSTISKNGELDGLYDGGGINFHFSSTTEPNSLDFSISSSKESSVHNNNNSFEEDDDDGDEDETENNNNNKDFIGTTTTSKAVSTSTRFPPSRRGPFEMSNEKNPEPDQKTGSTGSGDTQNDFPQSVSRESSKPHTSDEILSEESPNRHSASHRDDQSTEYSTTRGSTIITTTMSAIPSQHVLFTSPPDAPSTSSTPYRRNLQTTRFPTGRTVVLTSTTTSSSSEDNNDDEFHSTNGQPHSNQDDDNNNNDDNRHHEPTPTQQQDSVTAPTVLYESKEREADEKYTKEESQLKKMLLEEIPPHKNQNEQEEQIESNSGGGSHEDSAISNLSSEFNLPTSTTSSRDPLARIIKNLAPKWGRNRTIETTTMSSGNHKYDFTISSKEKDSKEKYRSKESSTRSTIIITPETAYPTSKFKSSEFEVVKLGGKRGSTDQPVNILNTIQSPNLSRRQDQQSENSGDRDSPFLDVLVGSEDHKTLITKQTEDGIVTSAILPPWYANNNNNGGNNNTSNTNRVNGNNNDNNDDDDDNTDTKNNNKSIEEESPSQSVFGGLLDFFKKLPMSNDHHQNSNSKSIVLKRPGGELLAQGSSYVAQSSETNGNQIKNPISFKDLVRNIVPGLQSTTTPTDSAVVTDDILPANNGYHYGSSDGGTNIYGYYPDEDQESDRTVEHHGVQSETLSDELMQGVQEAPSHSIELNVGNSGSSEIVVTQGNDDEYSRYGEGAETRRQVVTTPFNGGGIRRPISKEEKEQEDLEMKGSEIRPVFAHTAITTSQSPPLKLSNLTIEKSGQHSFDSRISNVSAEMTDNNNNSAEKEPTVAEGQGNMSTEFEPGSFEVDEADHNLKKGVPEDSIGSYEEAELSGEPGKWSEPDRFNPAESSVETDQNDQKPPPPTGSEEMKVNPDSGDSNEVLERRPVVQLDEGLYPDSADTSAGSALIQSTESNNNNNNNKVHQVFPVGYSSTTERPSEESAILEPEKSSENNNSSSGFIAPTPVSFHDNKYTFSAPSSDSIFQSKDGWRPLVVNNDNGNDKSHELDSETQWQRRQPLISQQRPPGPIPHQVSHPQQQQTPAPQSNQSFEEEEEEEEEDQGELHHDDELNKYTWGDRERQQQQVQQNQHQSQPPQLPKVRFPENPNGPENYHSYEQQQVQLPHPPPQQQQQQIPITHPPHQQEHHEQPHPPPPQLPPHHPHQQQLQQHPPHPSQQQRQQFHYQNNHNIDRSKYMIRPALPPIVMRRPPIQGLPYVSNRMGTRPQLIPQVQQQQTQFVNSVHPTEFPHPVNRRIFKNLGPRPRGNINWPTDETRKVDTAERRTG